MKAMFIVLGIILLLAAAAYFIENAYDKRRRLREAEKAASAGKLSPEDERMAEIEKLGELFTSGAITRDEFDRVRSEIMGLDSGNI